jgi:hypothetical protein
MHLLSALSIRSWHQPTVRAFAAASVAVKRSRESVRDR